MSGYTNILGGGGGGSGTVTSVNASGGTTGLSFSGGPITTSGTLTLSGTLDVTNGGTGANNATEAMAHLLPSQTGLNGYVLSTDGANNLSWIVASGSGTVTSVGLSGGTTGLTTSGGPITASGTITLGGTLAIANGGTGAATAAAAANALLPSQTGFGGYYLTTDGSGVLSWQAASGSGTVTSVGMATTLNGLSVSGSPITGSGTMTLGGTLGIVSGGTGGVTAAEAATNILPIQTSAPPGSVLTTDGANNLSWSTPSSGVISFSAGATGLAPNTPTGGAVVLTGILATTSGGTGANTANGGLNNLLPAQSGGVAGYVLSTDGTNTSWIAAGGTGTVTSVNVQGGTTGLTTTGGPVTGSGTITLGGTLALEHGGTGAATQVAALNNLLPTQTGGVAGYTLTTDGAGNVTWQPGGSGTVTSINVSGSTTGLTFSGGPITTSGTFNLGGTLSIANGGTGATTAQNARTNILPSQLTYAGNALLTNGTDCFWSTISAGDISGLGTIATQDADAVAITGGTIEGTAIGATTASTGEFTDLTATGVVSGAGFDAYLAEPPSIGGTTPNAGSFTTVTTTSGAVTNTPVFANDIANKSYVDSVAVGLQPKAASQCLADTNITLSGLQTIDGYTTLAGDRVIVVGQTLPEENGIYVADAGAWTRALDADTWTELQQASSFVLEGVTWVGSTWVCTIAPGGTLGTTPVTWVQLSQSVTYSAGTGLNLSGSTFNIANTAVTPGIYGSSSTATQIAVNAQGQITAASAVALSINRTQVTGLGTMAQQNSTSINVSGGTMDGVAIGGLIPSTASFTTLNVTGSVGGTGVTSLFASPPPIGSTAANTGAFTDLSASGTLSGTAFSDYLATPPAIGGTAANAGSFTTLSASGAVSGTGFSDYLASPPAIGGTAANAGSFTTLTASSTVSGAGITALFASPPTIGTTAPAAGYFTDLGASGTFTDGSSSVGAAGQALLSTGTATVWGNPANATSLAGGAAFSLPYQSATDATTFLPISSTVGSALICNGTGSAPSWGVPDQAANITGGSVGALPYQSAANTTEFLSNASLSGLALVSGGTGNPPAWGVPQNASYLAGGAANSVPYQTGANVTSFLAAGTSGSVFTTNGVGSAPTWTTPLALVSPVLASPPTIGSVTPGAAVFTTVNTLGPVGITAGGNSGSPLEISSTNTRGGAGFAEIASFTNGGGGTNPNKFWRMDSTGSLQLLNSSYSAVIFGVADDGNTSTGGAITQSTVQNNVNPNASNKNGLKGPNGYTAYQDNLLNVVLGDYTQTSRDTWIQSGRGIFLSPNGANATATNAAISAQLNSSGQFLIGTSSTAPLVGYGAPKLVVYSNSSSNDGATIIGFNSNNTLNLGKVSPNANGSGASGGFIAFVGNGSTGTSSYGNITVNGAGVSYNTSSDARLKENVVTLSGGLDKVKSLRPVSYKWIDNDCHDIGFIAQEAELVVPESVTAPVEDNPSHQYYQMDLSRLVPVLTSAIQEQQAIIEALQARLDKAGL